MTMATVTSKRILIVDDEIGILKFVRISLAAAGYEVLTALTGEDALLLASSRNPDVMVLDILMPGMSGFEVLRRLRAQSSVPVIVFSAKTSLVEEAMRLGANDFLPKPFLPDELAGKIGAILARQR